MRIIAIAIAILFMSGLAFAAETSGANWDNYSGIAWLDDAREDGFGHTQTYSDKYNDYKRNNPLGVGFDVILYEFDGGLNDLGFDAIEAQSKYDFMNQDVAIFGVVKVNAWRLVKNMFGE